MAEWPMLPRRKSEANSYPCRPEGGGEEVSDPWTVKVSPYPKTKQANLLNGTEFIVGWFTYRVWVGPEKTSLQSAQVFLHYCMVITSNVLQYGQGAMIDKTRRQSMWSRPGTSPAKSLVLDNSLAPVRIPVWHASRLLDLPGRYWQESSWLYCVGYRTQPITDYRPVYIGQD